MILGNFLGNFLSIAALWAAFPEGGYDGDYATIGANTVVVWNKYTRQWANSDDPDTPAIAGNKVEGSLEVTYDMLVGGRIRASAVGIKQGKQTQFLKADGSLDENKYITSVRVLAGRSLQFLSGDDVIGSITKTQLQAVIGDGPSDEPFLSVSVASRPVPAEGGNITVYVESNVRWEFVGSTYDKITPQGIGSGSGYGQVNLVVAPNEWDEEEDIVFAFKCTDYPEITATDYITLAGAVLEESYKVEVEVVNSWGEGEAPASGGTSTLVITGVRLSQGEPVGQPVVLDASEAVIIPRGVVSQEDPESGPRPSVDGHVITFPNLTTNERQLTAWNFDVRWDEHDAYLRSGLTLEQEANVKTQGETTYETTASLGIGTWSVSGTQFASPRGDTAPLSYGLTKTPIYHYSFTAVDPLTSEPYSISVAGQGSAISTTGSTFYFREVNRGFSVNLSNNTVTASANSTGASRTATLVWGRSDTTVATLAVTQSADDSAFAVELNHSSCAFRANGTPGTGEVASIEAYGISYESGEETDRVRLTSANCRIVPEGTNPGFPEAAFSGNNILFKANHLHTTESPAKSLTWEIEWLGHDASAQFTQTQEANSSSVESRTVQYIDESDEIVWNVSGSGVASGDGDTATYSPVVDVFTTTRYLYTSGDRKDQPSHSLKTSGVTIEFNAPSVTATRRTAGSMVFYDIVWAANETWTPNRTAVMSIIYTEGGVEHEVATRTLTQSEASQTNLYIEVPGTSRFPASGGTVDFKVYQRRTSGDTVLSETELTAAQISVFGMEYEAYGSDHIIRSDEPKPYISGLTLVVPSIGAYERPLTIWTITLHYADGDNETELRFDQVANQKEELSGQVITGTPGGTITAGPWSGGGSGLADAPGDQAALNITAYYPKTSSWLMTSGEYKHETVNEATQQYSLTVDGAGFYIEDDILFAMENHGAGRQATVQLIVGNVVVDEVEVGQESDYNSSPVVCRINGTPYNYQVYGVGTGWIAWYGLGANEAAFYTDPYPSVGDSVYSESALRTVIGQITSVQYE